MSVFIPGNADTIIDYDCVPSYSQILAAQIVNMNDNVIIPETSLKSGTIDRQHHCWIQNMLVTLCHWHIRDFCSYGVINLSKIITTPSTNTKMVISTFLEIKPLPRPGPMNWKRTNKKFNAWNVLSKAGLNVIHMDLTELCYRFFSCDQS